MGTVLPVLLFAVGGVLAGGAWSMYKQGAGKGPIGFVAALGALAVAGGVLWLLPGGD